MKNSSYFLSVVFGFFAIFLSMVDGMAEEIRSGKKSGQESDQEFLHFGNMGGVLPTLEPTDLKDPDSQGARLVYKYCGQCHNVPGPGMHTVEEWNLVFWRMVWRMQLMKAQFKNFLVPTYGESHTMFSYFSANALQAISAGDVLVNTDGAKEFLKICSQCHRLPAPEQHQPQDWRDVVHRMQTHMKNMGKVYPSTEDVDRIVSFLKLRGVKP